MSPTLLCLSDPDPGNYFGVQTKAKAREIAQALLEGGHEAAGAALARITAHRKNP